MNYKFLDGYLIALKFVVKDLANSSIPEKVYILGDRSIYPEATYKSFSSSGSTQILGFYGYEDSKGIKDIGAISVDS